MSPDASQVGSFSRACGLNGPFRWSVEGPDGANVEIRDIFGPFIVVGRDPVSDLVLGHPAVSRRHALLQVVAGRVFAVALDRRRGITWDGELRDSGWVSRGQTIGIGPFQLRLEIPTAESDTPPSPPTSRSFLCPGVVDLSLEFYGPDPVPGAWQVSRTLVLIGRSSCCRVQLPGPSVASIHAALIRTVDGAWLVDLLGPQGIEVAGRRQRFALVPDGPVRIGPHLIGVRLGRLPVASEAIGLPAVHADHPSLDHRTLSELNFLPILEEFGKVQDRMPDQFQQALTMMLRLFSGMHQEQMALIRREFAQMNDLTEQHKTLEARVVGLPTAITVDRPPSTPLSRNELPYAGQGIGGTPAAPGKETASPDLHVLLTHRLAALSEERRGLWQKLVTTLFGSSPDRA